MRITDFDYMGIYIRDIFIVHTQQPHFNVQYIPRNMHTVFALLCFVVVIHWLIFPYPSGLLHWHCGNLKITPVPAKQPWWIWINISCEFIMNDCITTTKQSTTKLCAFFLGYTVMYFNIIPHCTDHNMRMLNLQTGELYGVYCKHFRQKKKHKKIIISTIFNTVILKERAKRSLDK